MIPLFFLLGSLIFLLQRNLVHGFSLLCIHKIRIDLGRGHIAVSEHLRYSVDVRAGSNLQGGVGVPEAVKREGFVDPGIK